MTLSEWADLALIFLLVQVFLIGVGAAIALFYTLRGMAQFDRLLRVSLPRLRSRANRAALMTERAGENVKAPIVAASSRLAQAQRIFESATSPFRRK